MMPEKHDPDMDVDLDDDNFGYDDLDDVDVPAFDEDAPEQGDEDWGDDTAEQTAKPKKSSAGLSFNTMVIIGAVVVGAGVLVFNVMSQSKQQSQQASNQPFQSTMSVSGVLDGELAKTPENAPVQEQAVQADPAQAQPQPQTEENTGGFLGDDAAALDNNTPPQPATISPADTQDVVTPLPDTSAQVDVTAQAAPENSAQELLKQAMAKREEQAQQEQNVAPQETYPTPSTPDVQPSPVQSATVDAGLVEKMDQILLRMDKIENDIDTLKQDKGPDIGALEQSVSSMKEELSSIKASVKSQPAKTEERIKNTDIEEKPVKVTPPVKKASSSTQKTTKPSAAPVAQNTQWELRAAQPGRAWVSKSGEHDMQSVEVGQSLAGIGVVSAITYQNGRWLVQGSKGQIRQ